MIIKDESAFRKYYVCFERPCGSEVWTLAHRSDKDRGIRVFITMDKKHAAEFARHVQKRKLGNCSRIVRVLLPAGIDEHSYADIEF